MIAVAEGTAVPEGTAVAITAVAEGTAVADAILSAVARDGTAVAD